MQQEQRKEAALPLAAQMERLPALENLKRAEESEAQLGRRRRRHRSSIPLSERWFQRVTGAVLSLQRVGYPQAQLLADAGTGVATKEERTVFLRLSFVAAAVIAVLTCGTLVRPAHATYPGDVGRLAFGMNVGGNFNIYTVLQNGHDLRQLTTGPGFDACAYSPDGRSIAFCSGRSGGSRSG